MKRLKNLRSRLEAEIKDAAKVRRRENEASADSDKGLESVARLHTTTTGVMANDTDERSAVHRMTNFDGRKHSLSAEEWPVNKRRRKYNYIAKQAELKSDTKYDDDETEEQSSDNDLEISYKVGDYLADLEEKSKNK